LQVDDLSALNLTMLAPLLEQTTSVDPQFLAAYEYGAVVLPAVDKEAAVRLVSKGVGANPDNWKLYHHLGYIRWQLGQFREAAEAYREGARRPGAPNWMEAMAARMEAEGGDRALAREMFARMYEESEDGQIKDMALKRLAQLRSFDERDRVRQVLSAFRQQAGRCPAVWAEVAPVLRRVLRVEFNADGAPLDPMGTPYVLVQEGCDVDLAPASKVPDK
ncbi:MAG TPA: hypothetical protein VGV38_08210, partial [Pyrinomonadaceae bacterium]|nr:hypothetical protein [Pyrinomonadaceae bacterium]